MWGQGQAESKGQNTISSHVRSWARPWMDPFPSLGLTIPIPAMDRLDLVMAETHANSASVFPGAFQGREMLRPCQQEGFAYRI